jgi:methyl-accepting chemotaxis protein
MEPLNQSEGFLDYRSGDTRNTVIYYTVPKVNWKIISFIPYEQYTSENRYVLQLTAMASGISILLIIGLILFVVQWITNPLQALTAFLRVVLGILLLGMLIPVHSTLVPLFIMLNKPASELIRIFQRLFNKLRINAGGNGYSCSTRYYPIYFPAEPHYEGYGSRRCKRLKLRCSFQVHRL